MLGAWYATSADPNSAFQEAYQKAYPQSVLYPAPNGYDAVMLLAEAIKKGVPTSEIHHFLRTLKDFHGVLGTYSATGDGRFTLPASLKVVTEKGFEPLPQS